jgi:hypothetical protein
MIPSNTPVLLQRLLCQGGCKTEMRPKITHSSSGIVNIIYYCDTCKYGHIPQVAYAIGQSTKYDPVGAPPEIPGCVPPSFKPAPQVVTSPRPVHGAVFAEAEENPELPKVEVAPVPLPVTQVTNVTLPPVEPAAKPNAGIQTAEQVSQDVVNRLATAVKG